MNPLTIFRYTLPVLLAAQGEAVSQQTGVLNIGLEGAMLGGAYAAMDVCRRTGNPWLGLLASIVAACAIAGIFGVFTIRWNRDPAVVGTATNLAVVGLTSYLFESTFGQSGALVSVSKLPNWNGIDPLMLFAVLSLGVLAFLVQRTNWGLAARAAGNFSKALQVSGISPQKIRFQALFIGAAYAGLGGAYLSLVIVGGFNENFTAGRGFVALALVTFGRWRQIGVLLSALLIGFTDALQFVFQSKGSTLPYQLFLSLPYIVALLVLAFGRGKSVAPDELGRVSTGSQ